MTGADSPETGERRRFGVGAVVVLVIAALAITVVIGIFRGAAAPVDEIVIDRTPPPGASATSTGAAPAAGATADLYVHVSGAVAVPGLYVLPAGSRVVDAVAAAGGFAPTADRAAVNLARQLDDGEQLHAPVVGETIPDASGAFTSDDDGPVNLNSADAAQLDTLPRIGPAMAERIIAWRDENGGFTSVEDLLAVPGIGDKMLASLRDLVTV
ncbi:ComEA family DNA-binding protein [Microbacterium sp. HD4P20]|uniref:helix-hairpin-helix domain-containing protein n=1 Tax=Microbacterium sp. HD4P20 TaxID=2864874 RepID=UPI0020A59744|nr:ComEA family DNA-binding protein [Microbacterium sp. HD4P20]MCP2636810.1 ComEA family DNA-binding protein [Microbacterium sp. HD4P20]